MFGGPPREPESELTQKEMDLARSVQEVTEEILDFFYPKLLKHYEECLVDTSHVYPEVEDVLLKLKNLGWELGVCTNKPAYLAKELLERLNLENYLSQQLTVLALMT